MCLRKAFLFASFLGLLLCAFSRLDAQAASPLQAAQGAVNSVLNAAEAKLNAARSEQQAHGEDTTQVDAGLDAVRQARENINNATTAEGVLGTEIAIPLGPLTITVTVRDIVTNGAPANTAV